MRTNGTTLILATALAVAFGCLMATPELFAAAKEHVLYSFCSQSKCSDGYDLQGGVIFDSAGNLYGTTAQGGQCTSFGCGGVVFKLSPVSGNWPEDLLYSFCTLSDCADGADPMGNLIFDKSGNLYGTTVFYGAEGGGTVFKLSPNANGQWTESELYGFQHSGSGGFAPEGGVVFDLSGNAYGTLNSDGTLSSGTVFELTQGENGQWTENVLLNFDRYTDIGANPEAGLIFDALGNLYGTTHDGGAHGYGLVFQLAPSGNGQWKETPLHSFDQNNKDGIFPAAGLILDQTGNLYGTTQFGGRYNYGTVFELSPDAHGGWKEKLLHVFGSRGTLDGANPVAGLIRDAAGNLYGTTSSGGADKCGAVFELKHKGNKWKEKLLYSFQTLGSGDGCNPQASLTFDAAGNLYGTTSWGGANRNSPCDPQCGTVFEITP
jgi:uncharacterized repeat protein (TIGR03803 family)